MRRRDTGSLVGMVWKVEPSNWGTKRRITFIPSFGKSYKVLPASISSQLICRPWLSNANIRLCSVHSTKVCPLIDEPLLANVVIQDTLATGTFYRWLEPGSVPPRWSRTTLIHVEEHRVKAGNGRAGFLSQYPDVVQTTKKSMDALREKGVPLSVTLGRAVLLSVIEEKHPEILEGKFKCSEASSFFTRFFDHIQTHCKYIPRNLWGHSFLVWWIWHRVAQLVLQLTFQSMLKSCARECSSGLSMSSKSLKSLFQWVFDLFSLIHSLKTVCCSLLWIWTRPGFSTSQDSRKPLIPKVQNRLILSD